MTSRTLANQAMVERPAVAGRLSRRGPILFGLALAIGAGGLFAALEARRGEVTAPATRAAAGSDAGLISAPPPLVIPDAQADTDLPTYDPSAQWPGLAANPRAALIPPRAAPALPPPATRRPSLAREPSFGSPESYPQYEPGRPAEPTSGVVYQAPTASAPAQRGENAGTRGAERVEASMFANPATTVPKGAIIQAVLETALDSNRAGPARAIISRDVRSFDGTKVLIPRGSRLYGEYKSDVTAGQNRALIQWQRLMRPDGALIELDSPSADPLGRAGVRGKVNTHFFERFGGAILQSVLDIGVAVATRSVTDDTVIIGLPGATVPQVMVTPPDQIKPTLKVMQGTAVSVFVARDLDFTRVEQ